MTWKQLFTDKKQASISVLTLVALACTVFSYVRLLAAVRLRTGSAMTDPLHGLIGPYELSLVVPVLVAGSAIAAIVLLARHPEEMFRGLRGYTMLLGIRMCCMWLLPLELPGGHLPVVDATATIALLGFVVPPQWAKWTFFSLAAVAGACTIAQHAQYSVEVLIAPMAAWAAVSMAGAHVSTNDNDY